MGKWKPLHIRQMETMTHKASGNEYTLRGPCHKCTWERKWKRVNSQRHTPNIFVGKWIRFHIRQLETSKLSEQRCFFVEQACPQSKFEDGNEARADPNRGSRMAMECNNIKSLHRPWNATKSKVCTGQSRDIPRSTFGHLGIQGSLAKLVFGMVCRTVLAAPQR